MRTAIFLLAMLCGVTVAACGGGYGSGGGTMGYTISGTVSGGGTNHSGVTISLTGAATMTTTTPAGGAYAFRGLPNGNYVITPSMPSATSFSPASAPVTVYYNNPANINFTESP